VGEREGEVANHGGTEGTEEEEGRKKEGVEAKQGGAGLTVVDACYEPGTRRTGGCLRLRAVSVGTDPGEGAGMSPVVLLAGIASLPLLGQRARVSRSSLAEPVPVESATSEGRLPRGRLGLCRVEVRSAAGFVRTCELEVPRAPSSLSLDLD